MSERTSGVSVEEYRTIFRFRRRYTRLVKEESELPDLIVIDGGIGQLNLALAELQKLGLRIPIISIAKKFEEAYVPGLAFSLRLPKCFRLLVMRSGRDASARAALLARNR